MRIFGYFPSLIQVTVLATTNKARYTRPRVKVTCVMNSSLLYGHSAIAATTFTDDAFANWSAAPTFDLPNTGGNSILLMEPRAVEGNSGNYLRFTRDYR